MNNIKSKMILIDLMTASFRPDEIANRYKSSALKIR